MFTDASECQGKGVTFIHASDSTRRVGASVCPMLVLYSVLILAARGVSVLQGLHIIR